MQILPRIMIFIGLSFLLLQTPSVAQTFTEPESLWQKLCHWMWQSSCVTNLARNMAKVTEKSNGSGQSSLYLVNTSTGDISEWLTGANAKQPTFCANTNDLFYRRGKTLYKESIRIEKTGVIPLAEPDKINGLEIKNLYACTRDEKDSPILWIEDSDKNIRHLRLKEGSYEMIDLPLDAELAEVPLRVLAESLSLLQGMRRDGYHVWVRNHKLVGQKLSESSLCYVANRSAKPSLKFSGSPVWIGTSDYLFTIASED